MLASEIFDDGIAADFATQSSTWSIVADPTPDAAGDRCFLAAPARTAIATFMSNKAWPGDLDVRVTFNANDVTPSGRWSNALLIFDYQGPADFKFAGAFVARDKWCIGHAARNTNGYLFDASVVGAIDPDTSYPIRVRIEGQRVTLEVDEGAGYVAKVNHTFSDAIDGDLGLGTFRASTRFDDFAIAGGPEIVGVVSEWEGRFIADIEAFNTFTATVTDPDGLSDVKSVSFDVPGIGTIPGADPEQDGTWTVSVDMGTLTPDSTAVTVTASDNTDTSLPFRYTFGKVHNCQWLNLDADVMPGEGEFDEVEGHYKLSFIDGTDNSLDIKPIGAFGAFKSVFTGDTGPRFGTVYKIEAPLDPASEPVVTGSYWAVEILALGRPVWGTEVPIPRGQGWSITVDPFAAADWTENTKAFRKNDLKAFKQKRGINPTGSLTVQGDTSIQVSSDLDLLYTSTVGFDLNLGLNFSAGDFILAGAVIAGIPFTVEVSAGFGVSWQHGADSVRKWDAEAGQWQEIERTVRSGLMLEPEVTCTVGIPLDVLRVGLSLGGEIYLGYEATTDLTTYELTDAWPFHADVTVSAVGTALFGIVRGEWELARWPIADVPDIRQLWQRSVVAASGDGGAAIAPASPRNALAGAATVYGPVLARDAGDNMLLACLSSDGSDKAAAIDVRDRPAGGDWSDAQALAANDYHKDQLAAAYRGNDSPVLVWTQNKYLEADRQGKTLAEVLSGQEIYWSNKTPGGAWSAPAAITSDDLPDAEPQLAFSPDGTSGLLVYSHALSCRMDPDPDEADRLDSEHATEVELYARPWNDATDSWDNAVRLTDNSVPDWMPTVTYLSGSDYLVSWLGQRDGRSVVLAGIWNGTNLRMLDLAAAAAEGEAYQELAAARLGDGHTVLAWIKTGPSGTSIEARALAANHSTWLATETVAEYLPSADSLALAPSDASRLAVLFHTTRSTDELYLSSRDYSQPGRSWSSIVPATEGGSVGVDASLLSDSTGNLVLAYAPGNIYETDTPLPGPAWDQMTLANPRGLTVAHARMSPDLVVNPEDFTVGDSLAGAGEETTIAVGVSNTGFADAGPFELALYEGDPDHGGTRVATRILTGLPVGDTDTWETSYTPTVPDWKLYAVVDRDNAVSEANETNNVRIREAAQFNVRLTVDAVPNKTAAVDEPVAVNATLDDPWPLHTHTAAVDWGDGGPSDSGTVTESAGSGTVTASHSYAWSGPYDAAVTVTDNLGHWAVDRFAVEVEGLSAFEDFDDDTAEGFQTAAGEWSVVDDPAADHEADRCYLGTLAGNAITTFPWEGPLPPDLNVHVTFNADDTAGGRRWSNAFVIFDYQSPTDFKFAGAFVGADKWAIGHAARNANGYVIDRVLSERIDPRTDYAVEVLIEGNAVTLGVHDGAQYVPKAAHTYREMENLQDGLLGLGTMKGSTRFDDFSVRVADRTIRRG